MNWLKIENQISKNWGITDFLQTDFINHRLIEKKSRPIRLCVLSTRFNTLSTLLKMLFQLVLKRSFDSSWNALLTCVEMLFRLVLKRSFDSSWNALCSQLPECGYTLCIMRDLYAWCVRFANKRLHREPSAKLSIYKNSNAAELC